MPSEVYLEQKQNSQTVQLYRLYILVKGNILLLQSPLATLTIIHIRTGTVIVIVFIAIVVAIIVVVVVVVIIIIIIIIIITIITIIIF